MKNYFYLLTAVFTLSLIAHQVAWSAEIQPINPTFKKITKAPLAEKAPETHEAAAPAAAKAAPSAAKETTKEAPADSEKPVVTSHPSPGTAAPAKDKKEAPAAAAHGSAHAAAPGVDANKALQWLKNGNTRYTSKKFRSDGRSPADRTRLLAGQHPHTVVLSCADSRVPPELVFDQMLGEIFVVRVAGEALDSSVIASVEYAVEHLGPRLLVVMGHTKCGAVDTAIKVKEGASAGSPDLDRLLADIRPRLKSVSADKLSPNLEIESTVNADGVARDILARSEIIRKKVESGDLVIKPALYRMDSGKVTFY